MLRSKQTSLLQYHKSNSALDVMIGELRLKAEGMQKEVKAQGEKLEEGDTFNRHFRADLRAAVEVRSIAPPTRTRTHTRTGAVLFVPVVIRNPRKSFDTLLGFGSGVTWGYTDKCSAAYIVLLFRPPLAHGRLQCS